MSIKISGIKKYDYELTANKRDYTAFVGYNPVGFNYYFKVHDGYMPAHVYLELDTKEELEIAMREFVGDLRKWSEAKYDD